MTSRIRRARDATMAMLAGLQTSLPALGCLALVPLLLVLVPLVPDAMRPVRAIAGRERARRSEAGDPLPRPYRPAPESHRGAAWSVLTDPATWRDLCWLVLHGVGWTCSTLIVVALWPAVLVSLTMPAYWSLFPAGTFTALLVPVSNWAQALTLPFLQASLYAALLLFAVPGLSLWWGRSSRALLRPTTGAALSEEVLRLTQTRAEALESHGAELRRIERDLHDGVQAHLVSISVRLGLADRALSSDPDRAQPLIQDARTAIEDVLADLRAIVRGIYPPILSDRGLSGAIDALATAQGFPVAVDVASSLRRLPAPLEAAAYFVVAEALTNATKHANPTRATVRIAEEPAGQLLIVVKDNGCGGADESRGSGLTGIRRRIAALDGRLTVDSPVGHGTTIEARMPCGS